MEKQALKHRIDVAAGRAPADLRIANCRVIDVYNRTAFPADVLIAGAYIAGFGAPGFPAARQTFDAKGAYLAPGLIDAHVHIESSHLSPAEFSRLVVPCGTTTVIADPHEICNVCGLMGISTITSAWPSVRGWTPSPPCAWRRSTWPSAMACGIAARWLRASGPT